VVPAVDTVPVNDKVTAVHVDAHEPVTIYPVVAVHVYTFLQKLIVVGGQTAAAHVLAVVVVI
jgi:hypothetical protein